MTSPESALAIDLTAARQLLGQASGLTLQAQTRRLTMIGCEAVCAADSVYEPPTEESFRSYKPLVSYMLHGVRFSRVGNSELIQAREDIQSIEETLKSDAPLIATAATIIERRVNRFHDAPSIAAMTIRLWGADQLGLPALTDLSKFAQQYATNRGAGSGHQVGSVY